MRALMRRLLLPRVGHVDFGDFGGVTPISSDFGHERGKPIDRYYIERFLAEHRQDIRGRALEIADPAYCTRFGSGITRQDVLHLSPDHPGATIFGDLSQPGVLPDSTFDCIIITQTLHVIYDMAATVRELYNGLRPGGVLLVTVPGVSSVDRHEWRESWYWSLTAQSARRLFAENFPEGETTVQAFGNVYAATSFLQGLAIEDVDRARLEPNDPAFPVIVTVRAVRP